MKAYTKPTVEILVFRADENIASSSVFDYVDGSSVPVTLFDIKMNSWNSGTPGS